MSSNPPGMCDVCGKPGRVHLTEIRDGVKTTRSYCAEHVPAEVRDKMPFGPHRTAAEEIALLREKLKQMEQRVTDSALRAEITAEVEKFIADIQAGRRRLADGDET